eukprot:CAMPEP_0172628304 /NCGR_PEP_ID=MMETSP1068-20121228/161005_1 /TAXON_ID=35684 /ORGANISM="Pseudopedinella elastica, Strain CCMP716" /LENGTH=38 /DNA_ID= /DNA_START= /DNA_END= /DNA_ORIENTATION=
MKGPVHSKVPRRGPRSRQVFRCGRIIDGPASGGIGPFG